VFETSAQIAAVLIFDTLTYLDEASRSQNWRCPGHIPTITRPGIGWQTIFPAR
jgi:hypothetical protein